MVDQQDQGELLHSSDLVYDVTPNIYEGIFKKWCLEEKKKCRCSVPFFFSTSLPERACIRGMCKCLPHLHLEEGLKEKEEVVLRKLTHTLRPSLRHSIPHLPRLCANTSCSV